MIERTHELQTFNTTFPYSEADYSFRVAFFLICRANLVAVEKVILNGLQMYFDCPRLTYCDLFDCSVFVCDFSTFSKAILSYSQQFLYLINKYYLFVFCLNFFLKQFPIRMYFITIFLRTFEDNFRLFQSTFRLFINFLQFSDITYCDSFAFCSDFHPILAKQGIIYLS